MEETKDLIAYCGLYCGDCHSYKGRIADLARDLRKELRRTNFQKEAALMSRVPLFAALKNYPLCYEVLGAMAKMRCKRACRGGGGPPVCKIRECCRQKATEGCWQCADFETCNKLDFLRLYHEDAHLKNLRTLAKSGVDNFPNGKRFW